jgi:outer membrane immunogenic protein
MKTLTIHVAAISLLFAGAATAADMRAPVKAPPPAAPVVTYNWTGCYVGAGGGYGMFHQEATPVGVPTPVLTSNNGGRGWFGTVQVGCDYQAGSTFVIGAFADYDFASIKGGVSFPNFGWNGDEKLKSTWSAGGRIGWLPFQQLLAFVSGGYSEARFGQVDLFLGSPPVPLGASLAKHTYSGWFVGGGYEYGLGWLPGLFWKTEYRFADYGSADVPVVTPAGVQVGLIDTHKYVQTVRTELVWRFNFGRPVVARY